MGRPAPAWYPDRFPPGTFTRLVDDRAEATPDLVMAVDDGGRRITFGEYREATQRAAAGFRDMGVEPGDVVSWQVPNSVSTLVMMGALARLGAVQNPLVPIYREREVGFIVRQVGARLLVVPSTYRGTDHAALGADATAGTGTDVWVLDGDLPEGDPARLPAPVALDPRSGPPVAWLYYSSGSMADPKGARHTDATVGAAATAMEERFHLTPADRVATVAPLSHIGGATWLFSSLLVGHRLICIATFDPVASSEVLAREGMTIGGASAVFHQAYLAAQRRRPEERLFPSLRLCVGGGATKPPSLHEEVRDELGGIGIAYGYGLTEMPTLSLNAVDDVDANLRETEGRPAPGVEVRIEAPDGTVLPDGEDGEIVVRGPMLCHGYVDPALDTDGFTPDGWLRTGDLGHLRPTGHLVVTGRIKEIIIRKGENISAREVEDVLYGHPSVAEVAVIGLPDPELGERCCAVVVLAPGVTSLTLDEVAHHMRAAGLMAQKIPEQLEVVDSMPLAPAGKVLKSALREQILARAAAPAGGA